MIRTFHSNRKNNVWNVRTACFIFGRTKIVLTSDGDNTGETVTVISDLKPGSTRERLLDVAEWLFAEHGYNAVSVRHITEAAETRLASVNYHFKTKENLFGLVIERRAGALSESRMEALRTIPDDSEGQERLRYIVEAFIYPLLEKSRDGGEGWKNYCRLIAQVAAVRQQTNSIQMFSESFNPTAGEFVGAIRSALAKNDERLAHFAFQFMLGATLYIFTENGRLNTLSDGKFKSDDLSSLSNDLVTFVVGGMHKMATDMTDESRDGRENSVDVT